MDYIFPTNSGKSRTFLSIVHERPNSDDDELTPHWREFFDVLVNLSSFTLHFTSQRYNLRFSLFAQTLTSLTFAIKPPLFRKLLRTKMVNTFSSPCLSQCS